MGEGASPTRQSGRERIQTPNARERSMWQLRAGSSDTEDIIEVIDSVPVALQTKRTEINGYLRDRSVAIKVRALAAKAERPLVPALNHSLQEKGINTNIQIKNLTDTIKSLMKGGDDVLASSLLLRGTKTWRSGSRETTIDLVLASEELAISVVRCRAHATEHGSDYRAIETTFGIMTPEPVAEERPLFNNALLHTVPVGGGVQQRTDCLMAAVLDAIHALAPKGQTITLLTAVADDGPNPAAPSLHVLEGSGQAVPRSNPQKKTHWDEFLADDANIWHAAKYLNTDGTTAFNKMPPLKRADETVTVDKVEQAEELLATVFPPLPAAIEDEGLQPHRASIAMPRLTIEEVERRVFEAQS
ncbi:hypothetical protein OIDMADRAFT_32665 [Oidiodendron maius Zn]|uniref:Endonuclease/exonuclease/phosphatase domain-containing protein n=1 Tax=Oidiodendron maius (strain Zn) TaxID=913774 RepID=A0A0C3D488_OIDMZ|nr:hypothetical protein OIDMADRAFT_32665 [Oidiodendron maius Zn]